MVGVILRQAGTKLNREQKVVWIWFGQVYSPPDQSTARKNFTAASSTAARASRWGV